MQKNKHKCAQSEEFLLRSFTSVSPPGLIFECNSKPQSLLNSFVLFKQYCHSRSIQGFCFKEYSINWTNAPADISAFLSHAFFFIGKTCRLRYPQCNLTADSSARDSVCYASSGQCSLEQRWGAGYRGLVSSLLPNSTPPDLFQTCILQPRTDADSSDITWGNSLYFL